MKLTIAEATAIINKHLGVDVEIEIPTTETMSDGWIVNTKTSIYHPSNLGPGTIIDVMLSDGTQSDCFYANDLVYLWDTTRVSHIAKYRVID